MGAGWRGGVVAAARAGAVLGLAAAALFGFGALCVPLVPWRGLRVRLSGHLGRALGPASLRLLGVQVEGGEVPITAPAIYVCNHTSHLDVFLSAAMAPVGTSFVARRGLLLFPFFGLLYALSGHLLISRSRPAVAIRALQRNAALVRREGLGVWILPEGTRSVDGRLKPELKKGFVHLALATGLPVVPVLFVGAHWPWPKGRWLSRPGRVEVVVLPAVDTAGWRAETAAAHCAQVHGLMAAALPPDQRPRG